MFSEEDLAQAKEQVKEKLREAVRRDARGELKHHVLRPDVTEPDREAEIKGILHRIWQYSSIDGLGGPIYARTWIGDHEREQIVRDVLATLLDENKEAK